MLRPKRGEAPISYSEILRVIGQYVERAHLSEVRILETDEGLILQGLVTRGERSGERDTYQLSPDDISALIADAQAQRGRRI
jgi:hypothetical protein